jgi:chromosome segregation ATPase
MISEQNTALESFEVLDGGQYINKSARVSEIFELNERLTLEVNDWKSACENVTARLQAEVNSMIALQKKLESTEKSRDFFEQQLAHVQNLYVDSKDEIHRVTIQLGESDSLNIRYRKELARCKDRVDELECAIRDANESHSLVNQLDLLRNQFNDLKKHMIQREMDVESGASKQRTTLQIEHQGRTVYEKIIKELRNDLDESSTKLQDANFQLEKALQRCIRLEQLETEVVLYKESAKRLVEESQQVIDSATASAEQKFESENEWEALSRELNGLKNELVTTQIEAKRQKDELEEERRKTRSYSLEIMTLERKIAEFGSSKIESETLVAEIRRKKVIDAYEIENLKRSLQEGQATVNGLRQQLSAVDDVKAKNDSLRQELLSVKSEAASKENESKREISVLRDCELALRKEIQVLKENIVMLKEVHQSSVLEIERLHDEYNAYRFERENDSLSAMANERKKVELHVQALRNDLEKSISSLMSAESLQAVQEEKITRLSACLDKEKERSRFLSAELEGANDTAHNLQQQVSVFKNLDVYSSSRNAASKGDDTKDFGRRINYLSASSTILERARKKLLSTKAV